MDIRDSINYLIQRDNKAKAKMVANIGQVSKINYVYQIHGEYPKVFDDNLKTFIRIVKRVGYPGKHMLGLKILNWILPKCSIEKELH